MGNKENPQVNNSEISQNPFPLEGFSMDDAQVVNTFGLEVLDLYKEYETLVNGEAWPVKDRVMGGYGDYSDLLKTYLEGAGLPLDKEEELPSKKYGSTVYAREYELGDIFWTALIVAHETDISLENIAESSLDYEKNDDRLHVPISLVLALGERLGSIGKSIQGRGDDPKARLTRDLANTLFLVSEIAKDNSVVDFKSSLMNHFQILKDKRVSAINSEKEKRGLL